MELTRKKHKDCDQVIVSGRIDTATSSQLGDLIKEIHSEGRYNIVLDMTDVDFMSSSGLWVIVEAQKASKGKDKGELVLAAVPGNIMDSLELVGMSNYFSIYEEVIEAVGTF